MAGKIKEVVVKLSTLTHDRDGFHLKEYFAGNGDNVAKAASDAAAERMAQGLEPEITEFTAAGEVKTTRVQAFNGFGKGKWDEIRAQGGRVKFVQPRNGRSTDFIQ